MMNGTMLFARHSLNMMSLLTRTVVAVLGASEADGRTHRLGCCSEMLQIAALSDGSDWLW